MEIKAGDRVRLIKARENGRGIVDVTEASCGYVVTVIPAAHSKLEDMVDVRWIQHPTGERWQLLPPSYLDKLEDFQIGDEVSMNLRNTRQGTVEYTQPTRGRVIDIDEGYPADPFISVMWDDDCGPQEPRADWGQYPASHLAKAG